MKKIKKAVIPVAGLGTRFLPIAKTIPKEMLPVVDKPLLHHIVLELVSAGIEQIILVTSSYKKAIEDYFDTSFEIEEKLKRAGKEEELKSLQAISKLADFSYVRQKEQRGNGDAFLTAKNLVGNETFVGCWGDDLLLSEPNRFVQIIKAYEKYGGNVLACLIKNEPEDANRYGFAKGEEIEPGVIEVEELIEKPGPLNKPSDLAVLSGFVFVPEIFEAWENFPLKEGQELNYIDGLNYLRNKDIKTYALNIPGGKHYDCGNVLLYIKSNIELSLKDPKIGEELRAFIKTIQ